MRKLVTHYRSSVTTQQGFTLVELIVSVGIAALLMVGLSLFFSTTFKNMFVARETVGSTQSQFVVNTILNGKFRGAKAVVDGGANDYVVIQNDTSSGELPFTYISVNDGKLVMKDFFIFNRPASAEALPDIPNAELLVDMTDNGDPNPLMNIKYITDAKAGKIYAKVGTNDPTEFLSGFDFPTGIAYYESGTNQYLFITEPYKNRVLRMKTDGTDIRVIIGEGYDELCHNSDGRDHSATFCKLNFPTGLLVADSDLYIADTGNGRVLKVSDPGLKSIHDLPIEITYPNDIDLDHLTFTFLTNNNFSTAPSVNSDDLHKGTYAINNNELTMNFFTPLSSGIVVPCTGGDSEAEPPVPCSYEPFTSIQVADDLFLSGDQIKFENGDIFTINSGPTSPSYTFAVNGNETDHSTGENIYLTGMATYKNEDEVNQINVDLSEIYPPSQKFVGLTIDFFDQSSPTASVEESVSIRVGDGILGTKEDIIITQQEGLNYPTGLGWEGSLDVIEMTDVDTSYTEFDYTSDFELEGDPEFDLSNSDSILTLTFTGILGQDAEGIDITESYSLSASLN